MHTLYKYDISADFHRHGAVYGVSGGHDDHSPATTTWLRSGPPADRLGKAVSLLTAASSTPTLSSGTDLYIKGYSPWVVNATLGLYTEHGERYQLLALVTSEPFLNDKVISMLGELSSVLRGSTLILWVARRKGQTPLCLL